MLITAKEVWDKSRGVPKVHSFQGPYRFLSNMYTEGPPITYDGKEYPTTEHAYQAAKTTNENDHELIRYAPGPRKSKRFTEGLEWRGDWDQVKVAIMREVLASKFSTDPMKSLLLATGEMDIVEGNTWGDTFWGVCDGVGQNLLGVLLMNLRSKLAAELA